MSDAIVSPQAAGRRFTSLLVANRGEIAVRVLRSARALGYRTVAVYSDADADALHVRMADAAVAIGPAPAKDSYLAIDRLLAAARASGAEAIHPGYGFLSERADFAQAVIDAGLVFIGPDPAAIAAMGNKRAAKRRMLAAGVPCVPGYPGLDGGEDQSDARLIAEARKAGLPVMIKAAAGGGGRGMRLVHDSAELAEAIASARSEAANAFGSGELLVEKAVIGGRHVEVQIFGDRHGAVVHLGERDCSVQRRNQKVVEEAPSPAVTAELRARMGAAAVAAAKAVNYVGAGTVEFLLGEDGAFHFLEMNTRLQVEHPVTEAIHGLDLVAWQLAVAQGEPLPLSQAEIDARRRGHAIEVRLCSEDPRARDLPQTGRVLRWQPPAGPGIRVDHGLQSGAEIAPHYDSMQAKLIAYGDDREQARQRLLRALETTRLLGVPSNLDFLRAIVGHPAFAAGAVDTGFIARHLPAEARAAETPADRPWRLAALALVLDDARRLADAQGLPAELLGWQSSHRCAQPVTLRAGSTERVVHVAAVSEGRWALAIDGEPASVECTVLAQDVDGCTVVIDGVATRVELARDGDRLALHADGGTEHFTDRSAAAAEVAAAGSDGRLLAHIDGRIIAVQVAAGATVTRGQPLVVLEAMKMEFQLAAPIDGRVEAVEIAVGDQVRIRQRLLQITPDA